MSAAKASQQRWSVFSEAWRTRLWPLPVLGVLAAVALGVGLPRFDAQTHDELPAGVTAYLFSGGPEAARAVLSAVAGSLITVTSLIFSLRVVTLQLASSQYSPRLLRTFMGDQLVHATLALLLATFTYSMTVLRTVRASLDDQAAFVPQLSVTTAYLLAIASVIMLVVFLAHLARKIRVESILRDVHTETAATMRRVLEEGATGVTEVPAIPVTGVIPLCARSSGFLTSVDERALLAAAVDADAVVILDRVPGDSLIAGTPIAAAWAFGDDTALRPEIAITLAERAVDAVRTGFERTAA